MDRLDQQKCLAYSTEPKVRAPDQRPDVAASIAVICAFAAIGPLATNIFLPSLPAIAADLHVTSATVTCDDLGFSCNLCRRTIDRRTTVGPVRPANTNSGRTLHLRDRHDLVRVRQRPCKPADRQIDTGGRRLHRHRCFHVRLRATCSMGRRSRRSMAFDHDRNRSRPGPFAPARQRARSFPRLAIGIRLCGNFRHLRPVGLCDADRRNQLVRQRFGKSVAVGASYLGLIRDARFVVPARTAGLTDRGLVCRFSGGAARAARAFRIRAGHTRSAVRRRRRTGVWCQHAGAQIVGGGSVSIAQRWSASDLRPPEPSRFLS